ncbi:PREDICTED: uncharacterized protein LOC109116996 [Tarenaya hassleriana]|uniref:uncharacterized protein LOC109116996 n=1 Tax=Tarenaya hassleriana TaxID=28532 RepID=UPI0008FD2057|nr:PREDICTED: uncharacterized protein LOC109116996 [Tarenaya hassleriana]
MGGTCGFKVNTNSPGWHKSLTKILKKIKGGNFAIDVEEGVAYVTGQGNLKKLLKLMGSKTSKDAEMAFVKTGSGHQPPYDPNYYNSNNNYYGHYGQGMPFSSGYAHSDMAYPYPPPSMYYSSAPRPLPYHHQYPYSGYCNYSNYY